MHIYIYVSSTHVIYTHYQSPRCELQSTGEPSHSGQSPPRTGALAGDPIKHTAGAIQILLLMLFLYHCYYYCYCYYYC